MTETLGEAWREGWRLTAYCGYGKQHGMKRIRECLESSELDLATLVWKCGAAYPLSRLSDHLKCPRCGSTRVRVSFQPPGNRTATSARAG